MELIDSHCHLNLLDLTPYGGDLQKVLDEAHAKHVSAFLCVSVEASDQAILENIANTYSNVYISAGIHPNSDPGQAISVELLQRAAQHTKVVAMGETGLDYYRSQSNTQWQRERFVQHIQVAKAVQKPLIIHTRDAKDDTLQCMSEEGADAVGGVMHCFTEDWDTAKRAMDLGFYISFSGIVTFKNAVVLQEVAKKMPLSRMLIETDAPYLAPVPFRGKSNVPAYVYHVAEYLAALKHISMDVLAEKTTENFNTLFKIGSL